jgi:DNA-binding NtrC family response regulator
MGGSSQLKRMPESEFADFHVLVVEDDEIMRLSLEDRLNIEGIPVRSAASLAAAGRQLEQGDIDLVVSDIRLPDGTGQDLFEMVSRRWPGLPVILMTAYGSVADAVALVKAGALDYLTKPFDMGAFMERVRRSLSRIADARLIGETGEGGGRESITLGKSPAMRRIERLIGRLKDVDSSVLITGESGVGKEVVATLIHQNSQRVAGPLIKVNCAAIPSTLVEGELFGYEKGAFTGADRRRIGRFEQAQGGTIFLDEIAEIPPETQVKLLRVLQERTVERLGGGEPIRLDVRVIAATQVNLTAAVKDGSFRSDLYWRLNVIHVSIPPLRERLEDILYLARLFARQQAEAAGKRLTGLSQEAEAHLMGMEFPGNVRELKNMLERAVALCDGTRVEVHDLLPLDAAGDAAAGTPQPLRNAVEEAERKAIQTALARSGGVIHKAAESLGISRKNLWEKMRRYGIEP